MSEKPVIRDNAPKEKVHAKVRRNFRVEDIATKTDLELFEGKLNARFDLLETKMTVQLNGMMVVAAVALAVLMKVL